MQVIHVHSNISGAFITMSENTNVVDEVMEFVRAEVARRQSYAQQRELDKSSALSQTTGIVRKSNNPLNFHEITASLKGAEIKSYARSDFPDKLDRFPFKASNRLKGFVLKVFNFLFKDQREANFHLIHAVRVLSNVSEQLNKEVQQLSSELKALQEQNHQSK